MVITNKIIEILTISKDFGDINEVFLYFNLKNIFKLLFFLIKYHNTNLFLGFLSQLLNQKKTATEVLIKILYIILKFVQFWLHGYNVSRL
jgi:hypothetical protein